MCLNQDHSEQKHKQSEQIRLGRERGGVYWDWDLEGVQGYGCMLIYKIIHFNFSTHIVLTVVDSGGAANVQA